jgi:hypothetical protein
MKQGGQVCENKLIGEASNTIPKETLNLLVVKTTTREGSPHIKHGGGQKNKPPSAEWGVAGG